MRDCAVHFSAVYVFYEKGFFRNRCYCFGPCRRLVADGSFYATAYADHYQLFSFGASQFLDASGDFFGRLSLLHDGNRHQR